MSNWAVETFIDQDNEEHRHIIDFTISSEPDGFRHVQGLDPEQLGVYDGWEFGVYPEQRWCQYRAHGIVIDDVFYIIWLDQEHRLFP